MGDWAGILNLDKPAGISSAAAVTRIKRLLPRGIKIGHAGTLDPFATGVLLILIGPGTKWSERLMDQAKQYLATVRFGATTVTDDPEFEPQPWPEAREVLRERIEAVLPEFVGRVMQRPPAYSAKWVDGRRAYHLARKGESVELPARPVNIYGIEIIEYRWPELRVRIDCGRGTYIRSIARDLGAALNVGGYLTALRRTRVGEFTIDRAAELSNLNGENLGEHITPLNALASLIPPSLPSPPTG